MPMVKALAPIAILAAQWAALYAWGNYTESGKVDYCLDSGGAWNDAQDRCEGARSTYKGP